MIAHFSHRRAADHRVHRRQRGRAEGQGDYRRSAHKFHVSWRIPCCYWLADGGGGSCLRVVSLNTESERVWMRPKINFCEMLSSRARQDLALRHDRAGWKPGGRSFRRLEADRQQIARWR